MFGAIILYDVNLRSSTNIALKGKIHFNLNETCLWNRRRGNVVAEQFDLVWQLPEPPGTVDGDFSV